MKSRFTESNMRLTIFGGTGETGQMLVRLALAQGHEIVAFARTPAKLTVTDARLRVVQGDLQDAATIEEAIRGSDAVISLLGPKGKSPGLPVSHGMKQIVAAMQRLGVRRLVATATPSAADPNDAFDLKFKLAVLMIRLSIPSAYHDIVRTAEIIRATDLDWTIVRLPLLNSKPKQGRVNAGYLGDGKISLSLTRADLADFLLAQLQDGTFVRKSPVVSN